MQARSPQNALILDLSHWNGSINWDQVAAFRFPDGRRVSGAILKATEGSGMIDDYLQPNFEGAKSHGIAVGMYHLFRARNSADGIAEAKFFCSVVDSFGGIQALDIEPAIDIEYDEAVKQTLRRAEVVAAAHAWIDTVQAKYRFPPLLYSYPSFMNDYMDATFTDCPLWLSYPERGDQPDDVLGFKEWKVLQYSFNGVIPGVGGGVDLNEYFKPEADLMYRMDKKVGEDLLTICKTHYDLAMTQQDKEEWHKRAEEIRKAANLPPDA